jgi:glycosyltransferase involved in cell wall biosynthesis
MNEVIAFSNILYHLEWYDILFWTLIAAASIQVFYYLFFYIRIAFHEESGVAKNTEPVSIVVCARNEIANLKDNLPLLLEQDFPEFEVIVVNDSSFDGTEAYLDELAEKHTNLKPVHLNIDERYLKGKKFALTIGIKAAQYNHLLLTDADCKPLSKQWIAKTSAQRTEDKKIILGLSLFQFNYRPVNFISRIESFHTAMQYMNFALAKLPYMGVGRNLAYTQKLFFDNKGFANHQHLISGDDDLFVNEVARNGNYTVSYSPDTQTISKTKNGMSSFWKQKKRHFSSSKNYRFKHKLMLFLPSFSLFLFWICACVLLINQVFVMEVLVIIGIRLLVQWIIIGLNLAKFGKLNNVWAVPFWDPVLLFIHLFIGLNGIFSKPKTWK